MTAVREPAVAGLFYPESPTELRQQIDALLDRANEHTNEHSAAPGAPGRGGLRAVIAPHAGYVFSRVILLGPTHRAFVEGLALPGADAMRTPLGDVAVDAELARRAAQLPGVVTSSVVHQQEHSLEVHLPFLQTVLPGRPVLPLAVGRTTAEQVADVLEALLAVDSGEVESSGGTPAVADDILVVVSTDLSHYLPQEQAVATDEATLRQVLDLDPGITHEQACGAGPMVGLLALARRRGWTPCLLDRTTSADTAGTPDRVVGYASVQFTRPAQQPSAHVAETTAKSEAEAMAALPGIARAAIERHLTARAAGEHGNHENTGGLRGWLSRRRGDTVDSGEADAQVPAFAGHPAYSRPGAAFITLTRPDGSLRGCIGSLEAHRSLLEDVESHAVNAATRDPRFSPVTADELAELHIEVSVLSVPEPLTTGAESTEAEALAMLRPGVDGVILQAGGGRATFLPQVWESLPEPVQFMDQLRRKAGLPTGYWGPDVQLQRYTATEYHEGADQGPSTEPNGHTGSDTPGVDGGDR